MTDSPFVSGARVAIYVGNGHYSPRGYKEDFVEKVHKTGRFTLRSNPKQQWSPSQPFGSRSYWTASQTGDHGWSGGGALRLWDDAGNADITSAIADYNRYNKFTKLRDEMSRQQFSDRVTDEIVDRLQIVVLAVKPIVKEAVS